LNHVVSLREKRREDDGDDADAQQALSHAAHAMDCSEELSEPEGKWHDLTI